MRQAWGEKPNSRCARRTCALFLGLVALVGLAQMTLASAAAAASSSASGPMGLALAGLVAPHSPRISGHNKHVIARLFNGHASVSFPANKKIAVTADQVTCRISNVDVTMRSCELAFGTHKRALKGRAANELFATLVAAGVMAEGAAGSLIASISKLDCTLDPSEIKQKAGGGAQCSFDTGA